jgi:TRAP-type mannitol/chloroaromatic compound transport system permease small subunit
MFFLSSYQISEADEMVLAHPVYPIKFLLLIGVVLITLQGINRLVVSVLTLIKGVEYEY